MHRKLQQIDDPAVSTAVNAFVVELESDPHSDTVDPVPVLTEPNTYTVIVPETNCSMTWMCNDNQRSLLIIRLTPLEDPIMPNS